MSRVIRAGLVLALVLGCPVRAAPGADTEAEIQYLLDYVASSGCRFNRNGSSHEPADAADHLKLKYRRGKKYAGTAEQFIDRLASKSSWTGRAYSVDCDGSIELTGPWLQDALADYRRLGMAHGK